MTLRDIWESRGLSPTQVAGLANISATTLYKMNRKEHVSSRTIVDVCKVLGINKEKYESLQSDKTEE